MNCGYDKDGCICCFKSTVKFEHITAPYIYDGIIKERIHSMKFSGEKKEAELFAKDMSFRFARVFPDVAPDFVTFVPMTQRALNERGFNQSELLAKGVSKHLMLPFKSVLVKSKDTVCQHSLSAHERVENLADVFCVPDKNEVKGKTLILCDDIKTTGTTLFRCCEKLYEAGAESVYCLCIAVSDYAKLSF